MDEKLKYFHEIEKLVLENKLMLKILKSYCQDETPDSEEIASILVGIEVLLQKQEKIETLLETYYQSLMQT